MTIGWEVLIKMKCPNCRCVVPKSMVYCNYCGYEFSEGTAKTLTIEEIYTDRFYNEYDYYGYYGYSQDLAYENLYGCYSYNMSQQQINKTNIITTEMVLTLIFGVSSVFLLIILAILIALL